MAFRKNQISKKGSGTPLLFIHDLTIGSSNYEYHRLINNLTEKHEIYSMDLLGYGLSDKPSMTYTNNLYEQLITDFIKNIIGKKTSVIVSGESVPFVILACHNNPEIINKLICINPQNLYLQNQIPSKQTKMMKLFLEVPVLGTFTYHVLTNKHMMQKLSANNIFVIREKSKRNIFLTILRQHMQAVIIPNILLQVM